MPAAVGGLSRRALLAALAQAAAAANIPPLPEIPRGGTPLRVVILGAGLAGLCAGWELLRAGHQISILEARSRPGGRVETIRAPLPHGVYGEAGAVRIPSHHEYTLHYVRQFHLPLEPAWWQKGRPAYFLGGRWVDPAGPIPGSAAGGLPEDEAKLGIGGLFRRYVSPSLGGCEPLRPALAVPECLDRYDRSTLPAVLAEAGASPEAVRLLTLDFDVSRASAVLSLMEELDFRNENTIYRLRGGNDRLPYAFAERLKRHIRYGNRVIAAAQTPAGIEVVADQQGERRLMRGDVLLCTLPFSVLRAIDLGAGLSPWKRQAIERAVYSPISRVFLATRSQFWRKQGLDGRVTTDLPFVRLWPGSLAEPGGRGLLHTYVSGSEADVLGPLSEGERAARTLEQTSKVFPALRGELEGTASKCWHTDPFSQGAFVEPAPGQLNSGYLARLGQPEGRFWFAGEHISPWPAWMQGALFSGHQAALRICTRPPGAV